jgi:hypothetical protein
MIVVVVLMITTLAVLVWQKSTTPLQTSDYEGTIVDRWADYAESQEGSRPRFTLLVEVAGGKRTAIRVDPSVYESAKVGMRIKNKNGQIVLIETEKGQSPR